MIGVRVTHHAGSVRRGPEFALPGAQQGSGKGTELMWTA